MSYNYGYRGAQRDRDRDRDNDRHYSAISTGGSRRGEEHFARGAGRGYRRQQPYSYTPSGHAGFVVGAVVSDRSASRGPAAAGNAGNYGRARDERSRILAHHEGANPSTPALGADAFLSRYEADHLGEQERDREMEGQDGDVNYDRNDYGFDDGNDGSDDENIENRDDMEAGENRVGTMPNANHVLQTNRANNQDQQQQQQQALAAQPMHAQVINTTNAADDDNQRTPRELQAAVHAHVLRRDQPLPWSTMTPEERFRFQLREAEDQRGRGSSRHPLAYIQYDDEGDKIYCKTGKCLNTNKPIGGKKNRQANRRTGLLSHLAALLRHCSDTHKNDRQTDSGRDHKAVALCIAQCFGYESIEENVINNIMSDIERLKQQQQEQEDASRHMNGQANTGTAAGATVAAQASQRGNVPQRPDIPPEHQICWPPMLHVGNIPNDWQNPTTNGDPGPPRDLSNGIKEFFTRHMGIRVRPKAVYSHLGFTGDFFIVFDKDSRGYDKMQEAAEKYNNVQNPTYEELRRILNYNRVSEVKPPMMVRIGQDGLHILKYKSIKYKIEDRVQFVDNVRNDTYLMLRQQRELAEDRERELKQMEEEAKELQEKLRNADANNTTAEEKEALQKEYDDLRATHEFDMETYNVTFALQRATNDIINDGLRYLDEILRTKPFGDGFHGELTSRILTLRASSDDAQAGHAIDGRQHKLWTDLGTLDRVTVKRLLRQSKGDDSTSSVNAALNYLNDCIVHDPTDVELAQAEAEGRVVDTIQWEFTAAEKLPNGTYRNGRSQVVNKEQSRGYRRAREAYGTACADACADVAEELNAHNPSGMYQERVAWNTRESRRPNMKELLTALVQHAVDKFRQDAASRARGRLA